MFKPLVIGSRMELVSKKSLRNNEERIVYASQILDFNDDSIVCACKEQEDIDNCKIVDISGGGIRLQSKKKYQKDDYMMLDFDLDIDGSISHKSIIGKVVESRANDNDGTLFANRLQFVDIDRLDREEIIKYIFGQQRNILKKELSSNG